MITVRNTSTKGSRLQVLVLLSYSHYFQPQFIYLFIFFHIQLQNNFFFGGMKTQTSSFYFFKCIVYVYYVSSLKSRTSSWCHLDCLYPLFGTKSTYVHKHVVFICKLTSPTIGAYSQQTNAGPLQKLTVSCRVNFFAQWNPKYSHAYFRIPYTKKYATQRNLTHWVRCNIITHLWIWS